MFLLFSLLCLRFAIMNIAAEQPELNSTITMDNETHDGPQCQGYPRLDDNLESQGIYTGYSAPDKMLVFEVSEKSVFFVDSIPGSNEAISVRKLVTVRDACPIAEKTLSPNLTELLKDWGDECFTGPSQGSRDVYSLLGRKFMAVWAFVVPANQCFSLKFSLRIQQGQNDYHEDRLTILDGELFYPVVIESGVYEYSISPRNHAATISVVYFYRSMSRSVYLKVAPSLKTSDCFC